MQEGATLTLKSLPTSVKKIVIKDQGKGANWARNEGFKQVKTEFVLFSDNDINWRKNALQTLLDTLEDNPEASYSYGSYEMGGRVYCDMEFDADILQLQNYISTMSLIRSKDFKECGGFDEGINRFQDWDLWLNLLLNHDKEGVWCEEIMFDTPVRDGITNNSEISCMDAFETIRNKYTL